MTHFRYKLSMMAAMLAVAPLNLAGLALGVWGTFAGSRMFVNSVTSLTQSPRPLFDSLILLGIPLVGIIPLTLLFGISRACLLALKIGMVRQSFLGVTPDYLEASIWPRFHVRCAWHNVEWARPSFLKGDVIRLGQTETLAEYRFPLAGRRTAWEAYTVSLRSFRGYPDGALGDLVREYAPHLFVEAPAQD